MLILLAFLSWGYCLEPDSQGEDKLSVFNDVLIRKIESDDVARFSSQGRLDELRHRIGVLAVYFRIMRQLVPTATGRGYTHMFPEPQMEFSSDLSSNCSTGLDPCLNFIFSYLKKAHPWLLSEDGALPETELSPERLEGMINDNAVSLELSAAQALCYFTMKQVSAFEHLPFCRYRLAPDNFTLRPPIWHAQLFNSDTTFIDEFFGEPFSCAFDSFCPDPCCHDVDPSSVLFTERECVENVCRDHRLCTLQPKLNDDLAAMLANKWNVTCPCGHGLFFRADVGQCVHDNICGKEDVCNENEECVNTISTKGYKCVCQLGFVRSDKGCVKYAFSGADWDGPAISDQLTASSALLPLIWLSPAVVF